MERKAFVYQTKLANNFESMHSITIIIMIISGKLMETRHTFQILFGKYTPHTTAMQCNQNVNRK